MTLVQTPSLAAAPLPRMSGDPARDAATLASELPRLRARLLRQARFALRDESVAEDLVQDTLIAVFEQYGARRGEASLSTWATGILKHKVADWYRSPARRRMIRFGAEDDRLEDVVDALYDADGAYAEPVPAWQQPDMRTEQRQMMTVLERCVSCLPRQTGHVFMMREWLGFETAEICQRVGLTADNCRMILHRARMALRDCMQRDWIGGRASA